ncbi:MAG: hypothetical protein SFW66_10400 [Gammaproteobacteria bacterium]|nr:hypothetical protein [Gammaproteobacteria bacterium]
MLKNIFKASALFIVCSGVVFADNNFEPLLDKVTLSFNADKWVVAGAALVTVGINLSLSDQDMGHVQSGILEKLDKIATKADWHIVAFNRTQDESGLEKIQASAQARLPEKILAGLRDRAKALSKPGQTFTIDDIQFTPSEQEKRDAYVALRSNIYQQIKTELAQLNQMYPEQKYSVHEIHFVDQTPVGTMANVMMSKQAMVAASPELPIGDQMKLNASVVLASAPGDAVMNLVHGK